MESNLASLKRLMDAHADARSPKELFGQISDEFWLWCFTEGYRESEPLRSIVPAFPPAAVQERFTGAAGDATMSEAFDFYRLVKSLTSQHLSRPVESVLEFGCGWGRVIRLFTKDVEPRQLWGIDCMPAAIDICRQTNAYSHFELVDAFPPTRLPDDRFDLVYAYSVFSHLSEDAHLKWLREFRRILKPGGLVIATTRPREFILACAKARAEGESRDWAQGAVLAFPNVEEALARYDRGEFLYEPIGGGDVLDASFFGETCIPLSYARTHWPRVLEFVDYLDNRALCQQNVIVARKS